MEQVEKAEERGRTVQEYASESGRKKEEKRKVMSVIMTILVMTHPSITILGMSHAIVHMISFTD